jgi:hypothetical protein
LKENLCVLFPHQAICAWNCAAAGDAKSGAANIRAAPAGARHARFVMLSSWRLSHG